MKNDLFNDRISRFSIRKLNVGVCSVLLGTLVMLGTAANVSADEAVEDKKVEGVTATTEVESPANLPTVETEKAPETTYQADAAPVVPVEKTAPATTDKAEAPVLHQKQSQLQQHLLKKKLQLWHLLPQRKQTRKQKFLLQA